MKELIRKTIYVETSKFFKANNIAHVSYPNTDFSVPLNSEWVAVSLVDYPTARVSLGSNFLVRYTGALQVDLFSPEGIGTKENRVRADLLENHFLELQLPTPVGTIEFEIPESRELSPNEMRATNLEDNWSRYMFSVDYKIDRIIVK